MPDREILFKAKRLDNGEWVEGYYVHNAAKQHMIVGGCYDKSYIMIEVDPSTVSQYTGLTDRHGTRIFEGDIARCVGGECFAGYHEIDETITIFDITDGCCVFLGEVKTVEVTGNRWDNPELMRPPPGEEDA